MMRIPKKFPEIVRLCAAVLISGLVLTIAPLGGFASAIQVPATSQSAVVKQIGTVVSATGSVLTLKTDAAQQLQVNVMEGARILQLAPGSTNLKEAQSIALSDVAPGDRVLVTGNAGASAGSMEASRVILMKSNEIAQKHAGEQADWQRRGVGGIVTAVDLGSGTIVAVEGAKKLTVNTSSKTNFRRYAGDSVRFEDATRGTLAQIQPGDQVRVLGDRSADGLAIAAEEVISGSFKHLAGTIASISVANEVITLRDLATKKMVTVKFTVSSSIRALPPKVAAMFAVRAKGTAANGGESRRVAQQAGQRPGQPSGEGADENAEAEERSAGTDLSQLVSRLPNGTLADLKVGDAVMIVASHPNSGSTTDTVVTLLSGVEPILAATPSGTTAMTLSPWNIGSASGDSGAQQ